MDKEELQKQIALYYSKLPSRAQATFSKMAWLETLRKISAKYGLNEEQIKTLGTETTLVLLGIIHREEYKEILSNELGLNPQSTENIFNEIEGEVLETVIGELDEAYENNNSAFTDEKLDPRFDKLSPATQKAILDSQYHQKLYDIAQTYNLSVDQMGSLERDTTDTIVGVTRPEKFEEVLKRSVGLRDEQNKKLVNEINDKILRKIREKLMGAEPYHEELMEKIEEEEIILPVRPLPTETPKKEESPVPDLSKLELPPGNKALDPMLAQKLATPSFQIPSTQTDHSLNNISKVVTEKEWSKVDPYREMPE